MAHLLGSKYCIESLRKDVSDLHETVVDVFSRAGPVRFPSWKFPDKISADLDINELLEQYDYSEDEEERQVAHIVLLELVIERMVLMIQAMAKYLEHIFTLGRGTSAIHKSSNMSIGLVVKKYWNKMVQLNTMMSQVQSENKTKTRKIVDLENTVEKLTLELQQLKDDSFLSPGTSPCKTPGFGGLIPPNNAELGLSSHHIDISKDACNKSSQTDETAFVPCEGCSRVQLNLKEVGNSVIQLCKSQSLPSSLSKIKSEMENLNWMSSNDVARWTAEQNKDMARINKQLDYLLSTIEPLKSDLEKSRKTCEKFKDDLRDSNREIQKEKEIQTTIRKQYENKITEIRREGTEILEKEKRKTAELSHTKKELNSQVCDLKDELQKQVEALNELESAQEQLRNDLENSQVAGPRISELETEVSNLQKELSSVSDQLNQSSRSLAMEQAKGKSVSKHTQSLQSKQDSLLQRVDELDQENEELKNDVADLEEAKETLEDNLSRATKEKKMLEIKVKESEILVTDFRDGKDALEKSIRELKDTIGTLEGQVNELKEREKLIVEYPDLNGPVNADFTGTGDIALDMENQVKANSLRIHILEEQNQGLRNSISKMLQLQAQKAVNENRAQNHFQQHQAGGGAGPMPLWQQNNLDRLIEDTREEALSEEDHESQPYGGQGTWTNYQDTAQYRSKQSSDVPPLHLDQRSASDSKYLSSSTFSVGRVPRPPSGTSQKRQVPKDRGSAVATGKVSSQQAPLPSKSSIAAYLQLKNSGMLKAGQIEQGKYRPLSGNKTNNAIKYDPNYTAQDVLMCPKCDKIYTNQKDLEIHRTYCRS